MESSSHRILVVDDAPFLRELAALFLARSGRVLTASNGEQALEMARRDRPDLILSDLHMPGTSGADLCRSIKTDPELTHTPFVMLIAGNCSQDRALSVRAGADDVLNKPLARMDLVETVTRFLHFSGVRRLPRVEMSVPVTLSGSSAENRGTLCNLSRGGVFVEGSRPIPARSEVALRFALPESPFEYTPTAQVLWHRERSEPERGVGMGMRFVAIDGETVRLLNDYVYERARESSVPCQGVVS